MKPILSAAGVGLCVLALVGCASVGGGGPTAPADPVGVPIVDSIPLDGRVVTDVNIVLCQKTSADKPYTADEALHSLKLVARQKGATGLANVTSSVVTTPTVDCFAMAQATGIAFTQG